MNADRRRIPLVFVSLSLLFTGIFAWRTLWVQADTVVNSQSNELYFAQVADGGGYATQFLLVNPSDAEVSGTLDLFQSNGSPLVLSIDGTSGGSFTFRIKARGAAMLKSSNPAGQVKIGWARVRSSAAIGGSLVYSFTSDGKLTGEAGLDPSAPTNQFRVSVDTRESFLLGLALANPNLTAVTLSLYLYDQDGTIVATTSKRLEAMQHFAQLPSELFYGQSLLNFQGTIAVFSSGNLVAGTTLRFDAGLNVLASLPVIDMTGKTDSNVLRYPHIADGGGYSTRFILVNPNTTTITAGLTFYRKDGTPFSLTLHPSEQSGATHSVTLAGHGSAILWTAGTASDVRVGWARIDAGGPVGGSVIYSYFQNGRYYSQAGINAATAVSEFVLAVDRTGGVLAGLAVANPSESQPAALTMALFDTEGKQKGSTATWRLQAREQFALILDELFPGVDLSAFTGSLVVKTDGGKVIGTTLRFTADLLALSSIPVVGMIPIADLPTTTTSMAATTTTTSSSTTSSVVVIDTTTTTTSSSAVTTTSSSTTSSTTSTLPAGTLSLQGSLESPQNGQTVSSVVNGIGWAVLIGGSTGVLPAKIELLIDGTVVTEARLGLARTDVKNYYASRGINVPENCGFHFSWASFVHATGAHTLVLQATDGSGQKREMPSIQLNLPTGNNNLHSTDSILGNLRAIPAGSFRQGTNSDPGRLTWERPVFKHNLTKDLAVMETEVSRQMWADLRSRQSTLPADPTWDGISPSMTHPVQRISLYEVLLFANLISKEKGFTRAYYKDEAFTQPLDATNYLTSEVYCNFQANGFRVPSEGEWEYFTRAGTTGPFSCPETAYTATTQTSCAAGVFPILEQFEWFCANSGETAHPVGTKAANPWGLKDVHGNVREWCWDWMTDYSSAEKTDYRGPSTGEFRSIRGGAFGQNLDVRNMRSAYRNQSRPGLAWSAVGFRLVRSLN